MGERLLRRDSRARIERDGQELHPASRGGRRVVTTLTDAGTETGRAERAQAEKTPRDARGVPTALHDAFDAGCTTQTEANDVVVNYKLSGYAKNALKKYVPQLTTTYNAGELHDAHPVRFTNEGLRLDHKPENAIEWYVKIPHHEDYHLWMPAQPNPEQRDWLEALNAGDATMGESRLFERGRNVVSSRHRNPRRRGRFRGVRRRTDTHRCRYWGSVARHGVSP